jgi:single-stranded DNA-binding protein
MKCCLLPVILISDDSLTIESSKNLTGIRFSIHGFLDWEKWEDEGLPSRTFEVTAQHVNELFQQGKKMVLIDVRNPEEWEGIYLEHPQHSTSSIGKRSMSLNESGDRMICGSAGKKCAAYLF